SIPAYASVKDIPGEVDLAMVVVPKQLVLDVVDECGEKGIKGLVVISAGFREVGGTGAQLEAALMEKVQRYGMRLVGPNCMGVLNTAPEMRMNATFAPTMPPAGPVSLMSQSGAMGVTILDYAAEYGIGIHDFVSVGNKPDVSGNDLVQYWAEDERTRVILMYLENFGNPRKFNRLARRITKKKPIVVVKAGRTGVGARAASSHTGALAGADVAVDALLGQSGVIRVDTVEDLFDLAMAFDELPVPAGNRVAIVTNAGGPGIIIADACESRGLEVVPLSETTQAALREVLAEEASVRNPVDMIASATPESYRLVLDRVLEDDGIDAAIAAFVPPLGVRQEDVAQAIVDAKQGHDKPVLAVLMGRQGLPQGRAELHEAGVPGYIFPESAAKALAAMYRHRLWLEQPEGTFPEYDVDREAVERIVRDARQSGKEHLAGPDALAVFRAYGIPVLESRIVTSAGDAAAAAEELGLPVVMKIESPDVVHKTDVGGVVVDLRTAEEVRVEYDAMVNRVRKARPEAEIRGVLLQPFVRGGRETIIGGTTDPTFGPLLMFGLGGVYVEALKDVVFRVHPLTDLDAQQMVRSIRGYRVLEGMRGEPPSDEDAIADVIQRVSQLMGENPAIEELDINPFLVQEQGGVALDARIRVGGETAG
nr:GNAT family N-acetyltransferase [Gemmatimonadota bacterium]NIQ55436.1 GNAT family N-acetyltransferase [Gemmatimonadota bacterium]NIU75644.1 GNAT family N-acetyltransferase [Gammaproteobacteria bacterium]NIX48307.1 GNAT family N-acetyltransferase [Gemmatimonadota bacterium]NIY09602.1 GNAT family N-acetyltransferase [Gemmatimonadota bacterium]